MAPEQARGEPIDARADVYSLGSVLFRLVTGRNVFETEHVIALLGRLVIEDPPTASSVRFDVPEALDQVDQPRHRAAAATTATRTAASSPARSPAWARSTTIRPPTDKSASAVRKAVRRPTSTAGAAEQRRERPRAQLLRARAPASGASSRSCSAISAAPTLTPEVDARCATCSARTRASRPLAGGRMVAVLGVERSKGDEAIRAARAALTVARALAAQAPGAPPRRGRRRPRRARPRQPRRRGARPRRAPARAGARPARCASTRYAAAAVEGRFVVQEDALAAAACSCARTRAASAPASSSGA